MTELLNQRLSLSAGRVDLTNFFDHNSVANDETSQFVSDALVNNPMLGLSENGAGLAAVYDPKSGFTAKFGYQQSSSDATNLSDSLFYLAEVAQLWTPFGLGEGNYRLWYRQDNSSGSNRNAYGVSIDQRITPMMTLFGRVGSADSDTPDEDRFYSAGIQFQNGLVLNPEDAWGIGYAYTELGAGDEERLFEGYYNLRMTEKLAMSFHLTHVTEEPISAGKVSYLLPGVRFQASF
jgi:high affinity Mn2+ porin